MTSPVQVKGVDSAFVGKPNSIMVYDHDRTQIGQAAIPQVSGTGTSKITESLSYSSSFQGETQEGIIALYTYTGNQVIVGVVMVKVLLSA